MKKNLYKNTGITLIALIVTIIVMLILTSVSISMTLSDGIFDYAQNAVSQTENSIKKEQELINNVMNNYFNSGSGNNTYEKAEKDENGFLISNATYTSGKYTAVIPAGFKISEVAGEDQISTGLVIKDANENEFVWIPVTGKQLNYTYLYSDGVSEPTLISEYDTEKGYTQEGFEKEYKSMVNSVNENKGFYIGRYEATIDDNNKIGTKYGTNILISNEWYSLYENAKKANVPNNGKNVQTAMIYGVLWDETMAYITAKDSNYDVNEKFSPGTFEGYSTNLTKNAGTFNQADSALNIWGLASSRTEWTQEAYIGETYKARVPRGGGNFNNAKTENAYGLGPAGPRLDKSWGTSVYSFYAPNCTSGGDSTYKTDGSWYLSTRIIMYIL